MIPWDKIRLPGGLFSPEDRLLGIEVANTSLRYVYLEREERDYKVSKVGKSTFEADLSTPGTLSTAIFQLLHDEDISPQRIFLTISRRDTVIHQVTLPRMSKNELDEVVSTEIEKIPTFYNRDFDYIFRSFGVAGDRQKVAFAALARQVLDTFFQEVQKTEIPFQHLEIAPLNLKGIIPQLGPPRECEAVLVLHEHHTYINIFENGEQDLFYKLSIGLNELVASGTEERREHLLANWTSEIRRVLKSLSAQKKESQIELLWLVWDRQAAPQLDQRVAKDLGLNVEVLQLNKIAQLKILDESQLNPIYVLPFIPLFYYIQRRKALFSLEHFFRSFEIEKYLVRTAGVAAAFLALLIISVGVFNNRMQDKAARLTAAAQVIQKDIQNREQEAKELFQTEKEYKIIRQRFLDQATYVNYLNRVSWSQVLAVVAKELPPQLALTSFKFSESGRARIYGEAFTMESIAELIRRIEDSVILEKGNFDFLKEKQFEEQKYYSFGILAKLREIKENDDKEKN